MVPADQRLETADIFARRANNRLVGNAELAALERLAQVILEDLAVRRLAVHRRYIEAMLAAPVRLGRVQREVGIAHHRIGACAAGVADRNSHRCADRHAMALDHIDS